MWFCWGLSLSVPTYHASESPQNTVVLIVCCELGESLFLVERVTSTYVILLDNNRLHIADPALRAFGVIYFSLQGHQVPGGKFLLD